MNRNAEQCGIGTNAQGETAEETRCYRR